jgi:hypothetical protein
MESLPIAPTVGKRTRAGIPACLLFTSVTERNKHAQPNTVTNRMATYRVRAGSIVEPCGRVFHRVEQSPESKECQRLQPAPGGASQIARHMPPLPTSNAVGLASYSRSQPITDRPTDAVSTLALSPHSFPVGHRGKPLPSSLPLSLRGIRFCRTVPKGPAFRPALRWGSVERRVDERQDQTCEVHQEAEHRPRDFMRLGFFQGVPFTKLGNRCAACLFTALRRA